MASVVGIVPARGGSKAVPRKNTRPVAGRPLLAYTADAVAASSTLDRALLSTDRPEIADLGRSLGLEVPFLRPPHLATDEAPMLGVVAHALDWLEAGGVEVEALVLLQPTSPLRKAADIDAVVTVLRDTGAGTVVTVVDVPHRFIPTSLMRAGDGGRLHPLAGTDLAAVTRRQDKETLVARNGPAVLAVRPEVVRSGTLYGDVTIGHRMSTIASLDVDDEDDLRIADALLRS